VIRVAVLGAGHWGPNLIRNFDGHPATDVVWVADRDPRRLAAVGRRYPRTRLTEDPLEAVRQSDVDAVVIATPTITHFQLVRAALEAGKHVLVEKPLATTLAQAEELCELAEHAKRVLLVDHVFLYNSAVLRAKAYLDAGELGRPFYIACVRTNLGPIRADVNAAWDLAAQDVSILGYWLDAMPLSVSASGGTWINAGVEDAVFATLRYPGDILAHVHCSWLHPRKTREITIIGERKMLTYDDMNWNEPIRLFDKQVAEPQSDSFDDTIVKFRSSIREGDIVTPKVAINEPLQAVCDHFVACITEGAEPRSPGRQGAAVVRVLEAVTRSIAARGAEVDV
jgi:predicted dehydrogenase